MKSALEPIFHAIDAAGGRPLLVGGCVRDELLGIAIKDVDIEVFGLPYDQLLEVLESFGRTATVGRSFGVIKLWLDGLEFDFALPRLDSKVAPGHTGFVVEHDHTLSPEQAAKRRDYTINSMARTMAGELVDPYNGRADLDAGILRATSGQFVEDPLRVLRGMQFAGRFRMRVEPDTALMCRGLSVEFETLAVERIWAEFVKLCSKSVQPALGIQFLIDTGWLDKFPELADMHNSPQDPEWHPEGCVLTHTMHCMNAMVQIADREQLADDDRTTLMLAILCHDIGKPVTLAKNDAGRYTNFGHAERGVPIAEAFLRSIGAGARIIERVLPLVKYHMVHLSLATSDVSAKFIRRLARNLAPATIQDLALVMEADMSGRPPLPAGPHPTSTRMLEVASELQLQAEAPKPLVLGRHLIALGLKAGPGFKPILDAAFEAQLNGEFGDVDSGVSWVQASGLLST